MNTEKIYMAVTPDRIELPLAVGGSPSELSYLTGVPVRYIHTAINRKQSGTQRGMKFVRVEIEEGEDGCVDEG